MAKYFCEYCGKETNDFNEGQCPMCLTMDALHPISKLYFDPDSEEYGYDDSDNDE